MLFRPVMPMTESSETPSIQYPCSWTYAVIGEAERDVRAAVEAVMGQRDHRVAFSKQSAQGKYTSLHVELTVTSEQDRNDLFVALQKQPGVRTVI
ncbi:MAG TPA: DUF493 domain-containing protein [Elusimicrobiota bacterium]|nr:DUF493 domain-containing protein [Elusimicrobiota bacterium]